MGSHDHTSGQHFDNGHDFKVFSHSPRRTFNHALHALAATALVRIWHILLFSGAWSAMVCVVNVKTKVNFTVPNTMITVLGVLLGLTLSYRTSSAYEKYSDGRKQWSNITLASRNWARTIWLHCPDSIAPNDASHHTPEQKASDEVRAVLEKKTVVQLALAFAVAVKHYLREETGIYYEDLHDLVCFIPSLHSPSELAGHAATLGGLPNLSGHDHDRPGPVQHHPPLMEAEKPRKLRETVKDSMLPDFVRTQRRRSSANNTGRPSEAELAHIFGAHGEGQNVPLEITVFMGMYIATLQKRKAIDPPTITFLMNTLGMLSDSLANLERIVTTPIPWSYDAHIWTVSWIYCLALPFQLWASKFAWVTVPATVLTTYIVMGYASIAEEIENPFGYDQNDLNLGYYCREIIAKELDAVTSRKYAEPEEWIFSAQNRPFGRDQPDTKTLAQNANVADLRRRLVAAGAADSKLETAVSGGSSVSAV